MGPPECPARPEQLYKWAWEVEKQRKEEKMQQQQQQEEQEKQEQEKERTGRDERLENVRERVEIERLPEHLSLE